MSIQEESLHEPPGIFYYLCGKAFVNQPGLTDHQLERFFVHVNTEINDGITLFDGLKTPKGLAKFQDNWNRKCV